MSILALAALWCGTVVFGIVLARRWRHYGLDSDGPEPFGRRDRFLTLAGLVFTLAGVVAAFLW